jgi:hypothetical protein
MFAPIDGRIAEQTTALENINRQLAQIDGAVEKGIASGKVNGAMALANDQRGNRAKLQVDLLATGKFLAELKTERARIEGERRIVDAEFGPVRYLAMLLDVDPESAMSRRAARAHIRRVLPASGP